MEDFPRENEKIALNSVNIIVLESARRDLQRNLISDLARYAFAQKKTRYTLIKDAKDRSR